MSIMRRQTRAKQVSIYPVTPPYPSGTGARRRRRVPSVIGLVYVPVSVLEATSRVMGRYGTEGRECYVWWGGYFTADGDAQVVTALCPEGVTEYGRIHFGNDVLRALHERLRALDQVLLVELHTHPPGCNGQNDVDAAHPAATYRGFLSIVVPDFALPRFYDVRDSYVYAYSPPNEWNELTRAEIEAKLVIEPVWESVTTV